MLKKLYKAALCCIALSAFNANAGVIVDLELQLLTDVSGSVDGTEYTLQRDGYVAAFRDTDVINSILAGANGSIAVQYIEWSGSSQQSNQVDWFLIDSVTSANLFADAIAATTRAFSGSTAIGSAIEYGAALFSTNDYDSDRQVIDVSGDGITNAGGSTSLARDNALAGEVDTINGITIGTAIGLETFYQDNVVGGDDAFHLHATSFAEFEDGIITKLKREITSTQVPEPSSIALLGLAIVGLFGAKRKRA
jgi:hypothetical protein